MITDKKILDLPPHQFTWQVFNRVTHGVSDNKKILEAGMYSKFLLLGGFLWVNSRFYEPEMTQDKLAIIEAKTVIFINDLLKKRYGPDFLPSTFHLIRPLWQRSLSEQEQSHIDELKAWIPEADEDTYKHSMLLALGTIEFVRRHYYDMLDRGIETANQIEHYVKIANKYLFEVCGIPDFFHVNEVQTTIII